MRILRLLALAPVLAFSHAATAQTADGTGQVAQLNGAQIHYQVTGQGQPLALITATRSQVKYSDDR